MYIFYQDNKMKHLSYKGNLCVRYKVSQLEEYIKDGQEKKGQK